MEIIKVKSMWPEKKGFELYRSTTGNEYIFIHYLTPAEIFINGSWQSVKKGACILYDKYSVQHFRSPDTRVIHDFIHFDTNLSYTMAKFGLEFNKVYYPINSDTITFIIQTIEKEQISKFAYYNDLCRIKLQELFTVLARNSDEQSQALSADSETVARFTELRQNIHVNFDADFSVEKMASMVNLSPSRFHHLYKEIFGISPKKDYVLVKIEHAKSLMSDGKYSIQKIAELSGYNNQYHFIRQFHEIVGVTPGKYLKNINASKNK